MCRAPTLANLGDILDLWAIKFVNKSAKKPYFRLSGNIFSSAYVVKYVFG